MTTSFVYGFLPSHYMNYAHMRKRFQLFTTMTTGASMFFAMMDTVRVNGSMSFCGGRSGTTTTSAPAAMSFRLSVSMPGVSAYCPLSK